MILDLCDKFAPYTKQKQRHKTSEKMVEADSHKE